MHTVAPLQNVAILQAAVQQGQNRHRHLPGIIAFSGYSGWGKTTSSIYISNQYNCHYVACKSTMTKKSFLQSLLTELGSPASKGTINDLLDAASQALAESHRPLMIDEFDYAIDRGCVELIRDLYEGSQGTIIIIGEEAMPNKLTQYERFHNRIMQWAQAVPASLEDTQVLTQLYCEGITIADDLLAQIVKETKGCTRRICVNLATIQNQLNAIGQTEIDAQGWAQFGLTISSGKAPAVRRAA